MGQPILGVPRTQKGANVMMTLTQEMATDGQTKQLARVAADAAEKAAREHSSSLSKDGAQRVHGNPEFAARIREAVVLALSELSVTDQFADEEVESTYGYLSGYTPGGKSLAEQCNALRQLFPGISFANHDYIAAIEKGEVTLPQNAEGWFAIPNWVKNSQLFGATYKEAVLKVLDTIKQTRNGQFHNYREGQINEQCLRQSVHTREFLAQLATAQGDPDILIVPAQFGLRHRGRSVRRARMVMVDTGIEFGLGVFAVGCMLLTHPERLQNCNNLWLDASGDEYNNLGADERFTNAPCLHFRGGEVGFGWGAFDYASKHFGSVSGFVPQQK